MTASLMRSLERMRRDARAIFDAGIAAADAYRAVKRHVTCENDRLLAAGECYDLNRYSRIAVIGAGKASARMAQALEELLGERITRGIINVKHGHGAPLRTVKVNEAGHPLPDAAGYAGAVAIGELARSATEKDLVLCLISGGGSALLPCPADGITLEEKAKTTGLLLAAGATIQETNAVRKHLSRVKGGRLAEMSFPATIVSLIVSDVVGNAPDSIASGPTAPDPTTFRECLEVLESYGLVGELPPAVASFIQRGVAGDLPETPKPGDPVFANVQNAVIGSNRDALEGARQYARSLGYNTMVLSSFIEGEASVVAALHGAIAREIEASGNPLEKPACVISGGETTVVVRGSGLGGRNQEFALAAALSLAGIGSSVLLSGGTDGTDGPTDAAGALADSTTVARARQFGLNPKAFLRNNDSYHFFQGLGDLVMTGPTLTNVMDLHVLLID